MKTLVIAFVAFLSAICCFAQSNKVIIGTKKVYLKYSGSYTQNDSLLLPVVSALYPALKRALSDTALFDGDKLESIVLNYKQCACGTTGFDYEGVFFTGKFLSIKLFYEGMGAYPSIWQKWLTLNIETGKPYLLQNAISAEGQSFITSRYKAIMLKRIEQDKAEDKKEEVYQQLIESINNLRPGVVFTSFILSKKGIFFRTEGVLPHVVQALEPDRTVFFSYAQLRPFLKPSSQIGKPGTGK